MLIFPRQLIVLILILLQLVAPLLHAHSGVELNHNRLHLPGLEVINNNFTDIQTLEPISQDEDFGVVVGVCTGINRDINFTDTNSSEVPFISSKKDFISVFYYSNHHNTLYFTFPPSSNKLAKTHSSRAPPSLAS